jgi:hypothetical protein
VQIYFSTATFDEIKSDIKNTLETQISVIGGTMGLFTGNENSKRGVNSSTIAGFSILSGVEIIYYLIKVLMSKLTKAKVTKNHF